MSRGRIVIVAVFAILFFPAAALALSDTAVDYLLKTAPRPAGMGGAFTAVPGDPIGMFWNPAAALRSNRLAISGNHSLRWFPGPRKNLDQLDSDTTGVTIPMRGDMMLGLGFTVPGEWGIDYNDTNDIIKKKERYRGRERRLAMADLRPGIRHSSAGYLDSSWYRHTGQSVETLREFHTGGGFSFYYETENGMSYGINVRGISRLLKPASGGKSRSFGMKVTMGAAYRADPAADTLAAADLELTFRRDVRARWYAGLERAFDDRIYLRTGSMNGMPAYGGGAAFGSLRLDYAIVKNFLPVISGDDSVTLFQDAHFLSYTLNL